EAGLHELFIFGCHRSVPLNSYWQAACGRPIVNQLPPGNYDGSVLNAAVRSAARKPYASSGSQLLQMRTAPHRARYVEFIIFGDQHIRRGDVPIEQRDSA